MVKSKRKPKKKPTTSGKTGKSTKRKILRTRQVKKPGIMRALVVLISIFLVAFLSFAVLALVDYIRMEDYVKTDVLRVIDDTVVLGKNCTAIVAQTSPERARSIELGMEKEIEVRPNTHDIFADTLENFNITVESVTLDRFYDEIYHATIHLKEGNQKLRLDCKPSDGIALALRTESPIYIRKDLLQENGQNICK